MHRLLFTLYANKDKGTKKTYPYFVDVQNNLLIELHSRLVISLTTVSEVNNNVVKERCPIVQVDGTEYILLTNQMTTVPRSILKTEVEPLEQYRQRSIVTEYRNGVRYIPEKRRSSHVHTFAWVCTESMLIVLLND
ncbi:MAG: CcdB family protein [Hahellaceae bacterium]|nr:CcdB family protein [Hahellaceae bacterium]MCP5212988.1 CcdB family protein [Hahellaceae bacterium]